MSNHITIIGNLTDAPELRFTPSGAAVANFTVASTPRTFDKAANEWKDGETLFMRCSIWREAAENVAESLTRGTRVIVTGRLKSRSYEKDGEKRTVIELDVDEVGPAGFGSARVVDPDADLIDSLAKAMWDAHADAAGYSEDDPWAYGDEGIRDEWRSDAREWIAAARAQGYRIEATR